MYRSPAGDAALATAVEDNAADGGDGDDDYDDNFPDCQ